MRLSLERARALGLLPEPANDVHPWARVISLAAARFDREWRRSRPTPRGGP